MDRGDILSAEELRKRLYLKFKRNGIFDNLRSQLRKKLVLELDANSVTKKGKSNEQKSALMLQIINWLIGDHMKTYEYNYSLSVFAAEIGTLNQMEEIFTLKDILQFLNINQESEFYIHLISNNSENRENSILFQFLQVFGTQIKTNQNEIEHKSTQTEFETNSVDNLRIKLQQVDDFYFMKKNANKIEFEGNFESQLIKHKKKVEEKLRKELRDELNEFKDHEILSIKMEEREKCREEFKIKLNQLQKEHENKMAELVRKEMTDRKQSEMIKETLEKDCFNQRQEILSQLESVREQELIARRLAERTRVEFDIEKTKLENEKEKLKLKQNLLNDKEKSIDENIRQLISKERFEEREEFLERVKQLTERESEIDKKRMQLEMEVEKHRKLNMESSEKLKNIDELENELKKVKEINKKLQNENENLISITDYETIKLELKEVAKEREDLLIKIHSMNVPSTELLSLKRQLQIEKDNRRLDKGLWDEQRNRFVAKLDSAFDNNKSLASRIDQVVAINSQLHSVIDNLRAELRHESTIANTFYDTPLDSTKLPPELQLQNSWTPADFRLAILEKETEILHRRLRQIRIPTRNFDLRDLVIDESMNLNSTRLDDIIDPEVDEIKEKSIENEIIIENKSDSVATDDKNETKNENLMKNVNLDSLWEEKEIIIDNGDISVGDESQRDFDDW